MKIHEKAPYSTLTQIQKLLDLLSHLDGAILIPRGLNDDVFNYLPLINGIDNDLIVNDATVHRLTKVKSNKTIVGIDSSVVPIAESIDGFILAVKGCIVIEKTHSFENILFGPYPIYISTRNTSTLLKEFQITGEIFKRAPYEVSVAKRLSIEIVEKLLLSIAFNYIDNSLVLIDGPLTRIMSTCRSLLGYNGTNNIIVGFIKKSKMIKSFPFLFKLALSLGYECAIELPYSQNKSIKSFIVLLAKGGLPFRVEVLNYGTCIKEVLDTIYSSTITPIGYPEVLRCAHVFSKISQLETIALIGLMEKYGAKYVSCERLRNILFGPFDKHLAGGISDSL
ncbi:MAG: DNA double-strand break repair nuclease NurA [Candidatus Geothermarchaeota archaeon]